MNKLLILSMLFILVSTFASAVSIDNPNIPIVRPSPSTGTTINNITNTTITNIYGSNLSGNGTLNQIAVWFNSTWLIGITNNFLTSESDPKAYNGTLAYNSSLANYYLNSNPSNFLNATTISNTTIARIGNCPSGQYVQNTTTVGVQCSAPSLSGSETDPLWSANSSNVPRLNGVNSWIGNNTLQGLTNTFYVNPVTTFNGNVTFQGALTQFTTNLTLQSNIFINGGRYKPSGGAVNDFLKGDGSLDRTSYFNLSKVVNLYDPFGATGINKYYHSIETNRFHGREELINVTFNGTQYSDAQSAFLFDGGYEGGNKLADANDTIPRQITLDFVAKGLTNANGFTYSGGILRIYFYTGRTPSVVNATVYDKNNVSYNINFTNASTDNTIWQSSSNLPSNYMTNITFNIVAGSNDFTQPVEIEYHGDRETLAEGGVITKNGGNVYGNINVGAGTASLPSISFWNDTNTGFYSYAADRIGVSTGGTYRGAFLSTGFELDSANAYSWNNRGSLGTSADGTFRLSANGGANLVRFILGQNDGTGYSLEFANNETALGNGAGSTVLRSFKALNGNFTGNLSVNNGTSIFGNSTGNVSIDRAGNILLNGNATVWDDISVTVSGLQRGINSPVFDENTYAWYFEDKSPANLEEYVFGQLELPHGWKLGSNIHCHIHTHPSSTNVGNATFELSYAWNNIGQVENTPTAVNLTVSYNGTVGLLQIPEWPELNGTGKTLSSTVEFRLKRLSSATADTFTGNAYVDNFGCHVERAKLGSDEELVY